jgi:hypothetical protein
MTTATLFRLHDDVAVVDHDPATGKAVEGGTVLHAIVTGAGMCSVTARYDGETRLFLLDSRGRAWAKGGRLRLVPLCHRCEEPATTPVKAGDDPLDRTWCSEDCRDADAEAWEARCYGAGVAT